MALKLLSSTHWILAALIWLRQSCHTAGSSEQAQAQLVFPPSIETQYHSISNETDTSNLIFASFAGLLQEWPNIFAASGHSIITGVIPAATKLYHACNNGDPPPEETEWLAFDPEMSYAIHSFHAGPMELLTYTAQRSLRVIYLDGQSAALGAGWMDSQSVLINGTVDEEFPGKKMVGGDYSRARDLCKIGQKSGFEGVVRMNTGFELIWCNFKEGIQLIDRVNTTDPFLSPSLTTTDKPRHMSKTPFYGSADWGWIQSATQQYHAPGEVRVKLDPSTFISFYDRIESLTLKRLADRTVDAPRSKHRLYGISREDAHTISNRLSSVLIRKNTEGWNIEHNGVDWRLVAMSITKRYSHRLEELAFTLKSNHTNPITTALDVRWMTYGMLMPYLDFTNFSSTDLGWIEPTLERCTRAFTTGEYTDVNPHESITVIIRAIEGTLRALCDTVIRIFTQTIEMELPGGPLLYSSNRPIETEEAKKRIQQWTTQLDKLMMWLGWSTWDRCQPACAVNEICLIPVWPTGIELLAHKPGKPVAVCQSPPKSAS